MGLTYQEPGEREPGHGTDPRAEIFLEVAYAKLYLGLPEDVIDYWESKLLKTPHYASFHIITQAHSVYAIMSALQKQLFEEGYPRVDTESFSHNEAIITVVDPTLN